MRPKNSVSFSSEEFVIGAVDPPCFFSITDSPVLTLNSMLQD